MALGVRMEPCVLEGRQVRLEPLTSGHVPVLCEYGLDPDLWRWTITRLRAPTEMVGWVETALREQQEGRSLPFAIRLKASGQVIGSTRFMAIDIPNRRTEIGCTWIGRPWHGSGMNLEVKLLMLRHAFESWGCMRVEFKANGRNLRSHQALRKIGAVEEGRFRKYRLDADGNPTEVVWFAVTDEDWPACRARIEARLPAAG